jgi:uncharacterized protein (DUF1330 family)
MKKLLIGAALGLAACSAPEPAGTDGSALAMGQLEASGAAQAGARDAVAASTSVEVTARELSAAFAANEVAAMQKYGRSPLLIAGKVVGVELDMDDTPVVRLETDDLFKVRLHFKGASGAATAALKKGDTTVFHCVGLREAMGMPILDDCRMANAFDS